MKPATHRLFALALLVAVPVAVMVRPTEARADVGGKSVNIYINPLSELAGAILGLWNISGGVDFRIARSMTIGATGGVAGYSVGTISAFGYSVGPRLNFYLNGDAIGDSWYLSPMGTYNSATASLLGSSVSYNDFNVALLAGYHWVWNGGFNIRLGAGIQDTFSAPTTESVGGVTYSVPSSNGVGLALEFSLGWAF